MNIGKQNATTPLRPKSWWMQPGKSGLAVEQLGKDAARGPRVSIALVYKLAACERDDLGRAGPARDDVLGEHVFSTRCRG